MIEKIEPHKTGLVVMGLEDLLRGVIHKINEIIEKENEIIDHVNNQEQKIKDIAEAIYKKVPEIYGPIEIDPDPCR